MSRRGDQEPVRPPGPPGPSRGAVQCSNRIRFPGIERVFCFRCRVCPRLRARDGGTEGRVRGT